MRRFLCILLCIVLLFSTFALTAYADSDFSVWDFILSAYCDIYYTNNVASDPDKLVDFWESNPGKAATLFNLFKGRPGLLAIPSIMAVKDLNEASDARYMVAQLHKEQVEGLYDSFYDYWSNDSAEIRNMSLDEIGITFSADSTISVHGAFGYVGGSGTSVLRGTDYNGGSCMRFVPPDDFQPDSNSLYVYNGSPWYPAVIYVSTKNTIYHGGKALPVGYYYVLNSAQLLYIGVLAQGTTSFCAVYETDSSDNVKNFYPHLFLSSGGGSNKSFNVYTSGSSVSLRQNAADGYMTYEDALRLYSKAVGIHVTTDDKLDSLTITPPEDIPYDDDDNVVMMLPVDEPGEPVFMSPTVYNNYVDNGNVYNTDDHSNNVVNGDTVSNITNIYNNYITNNTTGSTYDDTKLQDKLDTIIDKLDKIYKIIKDWKLPSFEDVEPCYDNFWDCIINNMPIIGTVRDMYSELNGGLDVSTASCNDIFSIGSGSSKDDKTLPESSGSTLDDSSSGVVTDFTDVSGFMKKIYKGFNVDLSFYDPYRNTVRDVMKLFAYGLGFCSYILSFKGAFRIESSSLITTSNDYGGW